MTVSAFPVYSIDAVHTREESLIPLLISPEFVISPDTPIVVLENTTFTVKILSSPDLELADLSGTVVYTYYSINL